MPGRGAWIAPERHSCTTCAVSYASRSNLERHVRERHAGQQHVCDRCGATFARRYRLEAHVRTHAGGEPFQCSLCPATAASRAGLARHVRCHETAGGGTACPDCGQVFSHYWRMKLHRRHHAAPRFGCGLCGRLFRHNRSLTEHLLQEHAASPPQTDLGLQLAVGAVPGSGLAPELGLEPGFVSDLALGSGLEPELPFGLDPALQSALDPELPSASDPELPLELVPGAGLAPEPPELQIELDPSELEGELGAELAQLLGDGVRMELQQSTAADEAVMVITLVDE